MAITNLSGAAFVERGYGQLEPNHLSAQRSGQIHAQLPAAASINMLQNGQFVRYDYAAGVVDFTAGPWMLVFNEVKLYNDHQREEDFAMIKTNYAANLYSSTSTNMQYMNYVAAPADALVADSTATPGKQNMGGSAAMPANTTMVPRCYIVNVGDVFTTNLVNESTLNVGDVLKITAATGILAKAGTSTEAFTVVKVYTLTDGQKAVKVMRTA